MSNDELLDRYQALPEEARRLFDDFVAVLGRAYGNPPEPSVPEPEASGADPWDPAADPCFGMWADREETAGLERAGKLRGSSRRESA